MKIKGEVNFKEEYHKIKFKCRQCGNCCRNSKIRLSPYDILKLCGKLRISTKEFHEKYSYFILDGENKGLLTCRLRTAPECLFLGEKECKVYSDRPWGCRVFPLAGQPFFDGEKFENKFYVLEECAGFGERGKIEVGEFKKEQGVLEREKAEEEWVKFKIGVINREIKNKEEYDKRFFEVCYNFGGEYFKKVLREERVKEPKGAEERYGLIINMANKLLL